jgi:eukaryotic-like serine/threonine-protein kinase
MCELLTLNRLHAGQDDLEVLSSAMAGHGPRVGEVLAMSKAAMGDVRWKEIEALEPIVARMMTGNTTERFATANEAMEAMLDALGPAKPTVVAEWVAIAGREYLERCNNLLASNEDSWRSTSKIAIPASGTHPVAGFKKTSTRVVDSPDAEPSISVRLVEQRRTPGLLAWIAAGVLLFASAILLVVLLTRRTEPAVAIEPPPIIVPAVVVTPEPTPAIVPSAIPTQQQQQQPVLRAQSRAVWKPPPAVTQAKNAPPPAPSATQAVDCDPPFYYEGAKKIFKPSCM